MKSFDVRISSGRGLACLKIHNCFAVLAEQHVYFQIASTIHTIMLIGLNILSAVSLHN